MIDETGGGTRPELPVVLGGREATHSSTRPVPLRTILGASASASASATVATSRRRALTWWGSVVWAVAVLGCATSAFAIRDTMFPQLGRTEPPSAWQAPTRPPASIPYSDREGLVPTGTTVSPAPVAAADGTPLVLAAVVTDSTPPTSDDDLVSAAAPSAVAPKSSTDPTSSSPAVVAHSSPSVPTVTADASEPMMIIITTTTTTTTTITDDTTSTTVTSDTLPDDGGGHQSGRSPGGSTGTSVP